MGTGMGTPLRIGTGTRTGGWVGGVWGEEEELEGVLKVGARMLPANGHGHAHTHWDRDKDR